MRVGGAVYARTAPTAEQGADWLVAHHPLFSKSDRDWNEFYLCSKLGCELMKNGGWDRVRSGIFWM